MYVAAVDDFAVVIVAAAAAVAVVVVNFAVDVDDVDVDGDDDDAVDGGDVDNVEEARALIALGMVVGRTTATVEGCWAAPETAPTLA